MREKINLIKEGIVFDAKPDAIPFNYRISYKVSLICMIIKVCCGRRGCSLVKMHMIATAVSDREFEEKLKKYLQTQIPSTFVIRFEPPGIGVCFSRWIYRSAGEWNIQTNGPGKGTCKRDIE